MPQTIFTPDVKELLSILGGLIVVVILPLLNKTFKQGKKEILDKIGNLSMSFDNHWHDIECPSKECDDKAKTKSVFITTPKRRADD